jgi:hypothetical protein
VLRDLLRLKEERAKLKYLLGHPNLSADGRKTYSEMLREIEKEIAEQEISAAQPGKL